MAQSVTNLLHAWRDGDRSAFDKLVPLIYDELHALAQRRLWGEGPGHTLQPTALVAEACVRLLGGAAVDWQSRRHFYAVVGRVMRRLLVDHARQKRGLRRGGGMQRVSLGELDAVQAAEADRIIALDDALERLAALDPRKSRIVELRYFAGLSVDETAAALGLSAVTVKREWSKIKAWLYRELET